MRTLLSLVLATSLYSASPVVVKDQAQTGLDQNRLAQIPVRMKQFVDKGTVAGVVTLVARHGHVAALDAVGYTDIETRQPMNTGNIFQIHSMTKPVVAIAAMMLAEEGKLQIGDPVEKYLPEFRGQWVAESKSAQTMSLRRPARPVTLRDLMTHTSGMATNPPEGIKELHGALHKTLAETVLVESQQPLGMQDTYIFPPKEKYNRIPTAYILKDGKPLKYTADPLGEGVMKYRENAKYPLPEGGIYTTASDLYLLYQMMLNHGQYNGVRILSPASVDLMTRVHTGTLVTGTPGAGWGLSWFVVNDPLGTLSLVSPGTYGHGGRYGTFCFIDPKNDLIGIFMIQREGGSDERQAFTTMAESSVIQ
jgi:CubicO group peptidase (beta-lactamase class C family)